LGAMPVHTAKRIKMRFDSRLDKIKIYEAGKPIELVVREYGVSSDKIVKLASNENPYGCSPKAKKAVCDIVSNMAIYPDDSMYRLKQKLAGRFGVDESELIIGSGSDQVIELLMHAKASTGSKILINSVTFAMYEIYAAHVGAEVVRTATLHHDLDQFYDLYKVYNPSIIFICTPNNPTGDAIESQKLLEFLHKIDSETLVVIDGAYMEYAAAKDERYAVDAAQLIAEFDNLIYLGTLSKAYGLGGMRVGYGVAQSEIVTALYKLRAPFNITTLSLEAAIVALEDVEFVDQSIALNAEQMSRYESFADRHNIEYIYSYTNFITLLFQEPLNSSDIALSLLKEGMIVRDLSGYGLNAIRVTIGTSSDNDRFFDLFKRLL